MGTRVPVSSTFAVIVVEEGAITWTKGPAVDLVSREQFTSFEFESDWKVPPGGNSGILQEHGSRVQYKNLRIRKL